MSFLLLLIIIISYSSDIELVTYKHGSNVFSSHTEPVQSSFCDQQSEETNTCNATDIVYKELDTRSSKFVFHFTEYTSTYRYHHTSITIIIQHYCQCNFIMAGLIVCFCLLILSSNKHFLLFVIATMNEERQPGTKQHVDLKTYHV